MARSDTASAGRIGLPWARRALRLLACLLWGLFAAPVGGAARPPNVIVVLVDDLGARDLGCYGSTFHRTPHLDRLAREGVRFTQAYSACTVCSPTRAALLTGKHPARLHLTDWIAGHDFPKAPLRPPDWSKALDPEVVTLPRLFHGAGYATAMIGKWHLGGTNNRPEKFGFDRNAGGDHRGQPPRFFSPYGLPELPDGPAGESLTDREAAEAVRFIRENRDRPFFIYLAHYAVHQPIAGKAAAVERYRAAVDARSPQRHPVYAAMIEGVDEAMGSIRGALDELGLSRETMIVFTSDNGGLVLGGTNAPTSNLPWRSGKGSPYEGGHRVPLMVFVPGRQRAGTVVDEPVITMDLFPTLLGSAGLRNPTGNVLDGTDLSGTLLGRPLGGRDLYWHYPHYHPGGATPYGAIRSGPWKLIERFEDGRLELFDLESDPGEQRNLADQERGEARRLRARLERFRASVGAQMPLPNRR